MLETTNAIETFVEHLEAVLEERKRDGRRKQFDPANQYSLPKRDRRSGKDRRLSHPDEGHFKTL